MATRIPWRGKSANMITVGKQSGHYDFNTVQAALDSITDNAAENRYAIIISPGFYDDGIVNHDKSYVDLHGESEGSAILRRDSDDTTTGGVLVIGENTYTEDICISGLRIVRNIDGGAGMTGDGGPPEAAIFIGEESNHPASLMWHDVTLFGNIFEGVHDSVQAFGVDETFSGETGYLLVRNNTIRCVHDGLTMKGAMRMLSQGNTIEIDTRGRGPYLDDILDWKSTGFHMNIARPTTGGEFATTDRWFRSVNDTVIMRDGTNIGNTASNQDTMAGYLFYDQAAGIPSAGRTLHETRIINPTIRILYDRDYDPSNHLAGILFDLLDTDHSIPQGRASIKGGSIDLKQINTGVSAPADVWGIMLSAATASEIDVMDIEVVVSNAAGNAYAMHAETANATINRANVYSRQGNDPGGAGTIGAMGTA